MSQGYFAEVSMTRPSDTPSYGAGDVVGATKAAFEIPNIGPPGKSILITSAVLYIASTAVISGETSYNLHLYNGKPPSAFTDADTWDLPAGDRASYLGKIALGSPVDIGASLYVETHGINKQIRMGESGGLWGYLETVGAHTGAASRVYTVRLHSISVDDGK